MTRTVLIMAGGTGGHIFPGLAIADELKKRGWKIHWLGSKRGPEGAMVLRKGYDFNSINITGVRGKRFWSNLIFPIKLVVSVLQSILIFVKTRPDVVLGMGGYAAFPGSLVALFLHRPLLIHEQNAIPGHVNKILAKLATRVLVGFPGVLDGATWVGNPIRTEIINIPDPKIRLKKRFGRLNILVFGGSQGAQTLNFMVPKALSLLPSSQRPKVKHQTGAGNEAIVSKLYTDGGVEAEVVSFIEDMASAYEDADIVICRAGAITISELAAVGVASILIPFPYAVDDHQAANGLFLSRHGAANLISEKELSEDNLSKVIIDMDRAKVYEMSLRARKLRKTDSAPLVADICVGINV